MVRVAQICSAILVISAVVSAAPCGSREPSVATYSDYNTHLSCEKTNDDTFDDGKDRFFDSTSHVVVAEDAPCDDEVDGTSSDETNNSYTQSNSVIGVNAGKSIVEDIPISNVLNNLLRRDIDQKERNKSYTQSNSLIGVNAGKSIVEDVPINDVLNDLLRRDIDQKERNKSYTQSNSLIGVNAGKSIVEDIPINDVLNNVLGSL